MSGKLFQTTFNYIRILAPGVYTVTPNDSFVFLKLPSSGVTNITFSNPVGGLFPVGFTTVTNDIVGDALIFTDANGTYTYTCSGNLGTHTITCDNNLWYLDGYAITSKSPYQVIIPSGATFPIMQQILSNGTIIISGIAAVTVTAGNGVYTLPAPLKFTADESFISIVCTAYANIGSSDAIGASPKTANSFYVTTSSGMTGGTSVNFTATGF